MGADRYSQTGNNRLEYRAGIRKTGPPLPNFKGYFIIQYDKPFASWGTSDSGKLTPGSLTLTSAACAAWVSFHKETEQVQVRVGDFLHQPGAGAGESG